ncbi:DNA polymerase III subunit gamma/tau [Polaromonas glacialis]|uniref:DNA polymerase III subunit gamma/tau n=1 Tax=Polaromonas glacialis TaxID=866564 RepID=UPI0004979B82|nr:DNA polymerase III subunit gamma/tau [Polaromonas glacialis]
MSYLVLARKYRPRNFSEMVGQSHVVQALGNALGTGRLHHAYLFTGTRGVGKTTVSRILAKSLNCTGIDGQGGITAEPCGVCDACRDIDSGRFVDYTELDAASNRGVDEIAQLLEQAVYKPVVGRFKVFMIDEVHMLTNTAFNAMLKTLEEPPEYLKFVLATTDPQKVPATVLSRCLQFNLRPMAPETVLEHLVHVLAIENVPAEPQALRLLSRAARGSMRDALSLTDQAIAFGSGRLDEASVRVMLGSVDRSYVFRLIDALARGDGRTVVETSEVLRLNGLSAASTLEEMATILQRMAVLQAVPGIGAGDDETDPEVVETARLAHAMPADETQLLYSLCLHGRGELGLAPDEYAALTMVLLRLLAFKPTGAVVPAAAGAQPVALKPAPGSAAEPAKKSLPEPALAPAASRLNAAPASPAVLQEDPLQALPAQEVPAPPLKVFYELNKAFLHAGIALSAINNEACAEPAPAPGQPSADTVGQDDSLGDTWVRIVNEMVAAESIAALTRELALQSQLCGQGEGLWTLRVERESLNQPAAREKLQVALQAALNDDALRLAIELGAVTDTPARRNSAALVERQQAAEQLIQNDPFVQDMIRQWGARIVPGSIKSVSS